MPVGTAMAYFEIEVSYFIRVFASATRKPDQGAFVAIQLAG